jgi:hypothetical protein
MHPDISEFSYGYALTETLINASPIPVRAAPVFPSLIQEGKKGGGYDVKVPFAGIPIFLQFKLSHCMVKKTAHEASIGLLSIPFYRMHLRPTKHSQQHPMLLDLEGSRAAVFYAAPKFHEPEELNRAYISKSVVGKSLFVRPSAIGALPDDNDHHLAFRAGGGRVYLFSKEPRVVREDDLGASELMAVLKNGANYRRMETTEESVMSWNKELYRIVRKHISRIRWASEGQLDSLAERDPLQQFTYLSSAFFGSQVIMVSPIDGAGEV